MEATKQKKDHSKKIENVILEVLENVKKDQTKLFLEIDRLLLLEKITRLDNDVKSSKKIVITILQLCIDQKKWEKISEYTELLCKKHAQLKVVITEIIKFVYKSLNKILDRKIRMNLMEVIRKHSKGKMHIELEYARVSKKLSEIKEDEDNINEANLLLQEVQVETIGAMEFVEKFEYLLEQFRLTLRVNDMIRADLAMKKMNIKKLSEFPEINKLKIKYYELLIKYYICSNNFFEISKSYVEMYKLYKKENDNIWKELLSKGILFLTLAEYDLDIVNLRKSILKDKNLKNEDLKIYREILILLTTKKVINWPLSFENQLFTNHSDMFASEKGNYYKKAFKKTFISHNFLVISKYYSFIKLEKLSFFLKLNKDECLIELCDRIQKGHFYALINRPSEIICFEKSKGVYDVLNVWADNANLFLKRVEKVCSLIARENMVYNIKDN